jgi:tetratricopeptide (TPR) repeat protein
LVFVLAGTHAGADTGPKKSEALVILDRAFSAEKDPKALEKALAELDALIAKNANDKVAHYARGWVLSRTGKNNNEAIAAYDRAYELDARFADAAYNAGVVFGRTNNTKDAIVRFERALKANPKHADAAYNAGQSYYDLGEFALAAARWETAAKLQPDDFQIAKKLVQAYVGLDKPDKVRKARDRVLAMWKSGKDPSVGKLKSYVYDQFIAGKYHVYVYETFDPSGDLAYVWQAKVVLKDKVVGSVNLETSAVLREKGMPYIVGVDKEGEHSTIAEHAWKRQPGYKVWKAIALETIDAKF